MPIVELGLHPEELGDALALLGLRYAAGITNDMGTGGSLVEYGVLHLFPDFSPALIYCGGEGAETNRVADDPQGRSARLGRIFGAIDLYYRSSRQL